MANLNQLSVLKKDVQLFNKLRELALLPNSSDDAKEFAQIDLSYANLNNTNLDKANLENANLFGAELNGSHLSDANLSGANLMHTKILESELSNVNMENSNLSFAKLNKAILENVNLHGAELFHADLVSAKIVNSNLNSAVLLFSDLSNAVICNETDLRGANLSEANMEGVFIENVKFEETLFFRANLKNANMEKTNLCGASFIGADLIEANLRKANLYKVNLSWSKLFNANFEYANLNSANLFGATFHHANFSSSKLVDANLICSDLSYANFNKSNLHNARLTGCTIVNTDFSDADISDCNVYGISAWDVYTNDNTKQNNLVITDWGPKITVDNLEVAQFIYLLLNNQKIRNIIDTMTSKVVLILGRFTEERKQVLNLIKEELRKRNYTPVIFDFDKSFSRDTKETVMLLANMSRFVIADITEPKSIPEELTTIVMSLPSVPIQPILLKGQKPWGMFDGIANYQTVLDIYYYDNEELLNSIINNMIRPAEEFRKKQEERMKRILAQA